MLYVFSILTAPAPEQEIIGINQPIAYIQVDNLVAAYEPELDIEMLKQSGEAELIAAIVQHDRVICELFTQQTLLPLRFGTAFVSEAALKEYLQANQAKLSDRLNQISGYGEYLLKGQVAQPEIKPDPNLKGRDYLLAKKQQYADLQQAQQDQKQQQAQLVELLRSHTDQNHIQIATPQEAEDLRIFLLLTSAQAEQLNQVIAQWQGDYRSWRLELGSLLPPYHFAEI
ncbi:Gas vesicle synthesis GvpLGvpF [Thalassoporum mexicanum PCC 7367]|uniref:GvpL/GvpF family gas vesicle protein n=1 Tax=Thalassoporum mexicanum TaxID=3457544 RepID=UPI00029FD537|nr:GvpL/GvpF family gas vesicle protein [Pseudanabaena sp. PCC 7367]AFY69671.1 Gas vesicle synthesis GvpLGvpF [Pseudanabaena sp. PCC 7367]